MDYIKHIPLALSLALFSYYYFASSESKSKAGLALRLVNVAAATLLMGWLFVLFMGRHYEFKYVYENSNDALTVLYRISSIWAGQAGTFLLWFWLVALLLVIVRGIEPKLQRGYYLGISLVMIMLGVFLELSNPFEKIVIQEGFKITDGMGLNPLLINPWMAIHPPMVFIGYALIAAPFAFAVAGVLTKDFSGWVRVARGWTLAAWAFLGAGIFLGSFWAYEVLGWGGYWGWDPVENASVFPWLVLGALAHGLIIQGAGKRFSFWNIVLAFSSLLMVVVTAFLTRSGALASFSVHSFEKSDLFYPILISLIAFAVYSAALIVISYAGIKKEAGDTPAPALPLGPSLLAWTSIVMVVLLGFIAAGTLYPVFSGSMAAVNQTYYNKTTFLVAVPLGILLLVCPFIFVKNVRGINSQLRIALTVAGGILAAVVVFLAGSKNPWFFILGAIGGAVVVANVMNVIHFLAAKRFNLASYVVHLGVGLLFVGVLASAAPGGKKERIALTPGMSAKSPQAEITFNKFDELETKLRSHLTVKYKGIKKDVIIEASTTPGRDVVKPAIISSGMTDLYISPVQVEPVQMMQQDVSAQGENVVEITADKKSQIGPYEFQVERWNIEHMQDQGVVIAVVKMFTGGKEQSIELPFNANTQNRDGAGAFNLPDGSSIIVTQIDASSKTVYVLVRGKDAPKTAAPSAGQGQIVPKIHYDISVKPFISLLWAGMILVCLGSFIAAFTRLKKIDTGSRAGE